MAGAVADPAEAAASLRVGREHGRLPPAVRIPETANDDLRSTAYRTGPSCVSKMKCCPSRRFGVAVSPVMYRARTSLRICPNDENDAAGEGVNLQRGAHLMVNFVDDRPRRTHTWASK